ncbi:histidine phosphatase family protein [Guyparkeria sp. TX1]|uniref:histidine phosphatase family protein n=1 Tax=Guyparkeria sp. TX1 TaxID=3115001 RepID=UPI003977A16A
MTSQTTRLDLIRHGEPVGGRRFRGDAVDDPLSELGWQQLERRLTMIEARGEADWDVIATSPMRRCRAFAASVAERRGLELVVDPDLREIGFGPWEGLRHAEIPERYPEQHAAFLADPVDGRPPGSEPMADFFERVTRGLARLETNHAGQSVLVLSHAIVMRVACAWVLNAPMAAIAHVETEYAAMLSIRHNHRGRRLLGLDNGLDNGLSGDRA